MARRRKRDLQTDAIAGASPAPIASDDPALFSDTPSLAQDVAFGTTTGNVLIRRNQRILGKDPTDLTPAEWNVLRRNSALADEYRRSTARRFSAQPEIVEQPEAASDDFVAGRQRIAGPDGELPTDVSPEEAAQMHLRVRGGRAPLTPEERASRRQQALTRRRTIEATRAAEEAARAERASEHGRKQVQARAARRRMLGLPPESPAQTAAQAPVQAQPSTQPTRPQRTGQSAVELLAGHPSAFGDQIVQSEDGVFVQYQTGFEPQVVAPTPEGEFITAPEAFERLSESSPALHSQINSLQNESARLEEALAQGTFTAEEAAVMRSLHNQKVGEFLKRNPIRRRKSMAEQFEDETYTDAQGRRYTRTVRNGVPTWTELSGEPDDPMLHQQNQEADLRKGFLDFKKAMTVKGGLGESDTVPRDEEVWEAYDAWRAEAARRAQIAGEVGKIADVPRGTSQDRGSPLTQADHDRIVAEIVKEHPEWSSQQRRQEWEKRVAKLRDQAFEAAHPMIEAVP